LSILDSIKFLIFAPILNLLSIEDRKMLILPKETESMNSEIENQEFSNFEKTSIREANINFTK